MTKKENIAKGIRVLSSPPVMVTALILILAYTRNTFFRNNIEIIVPILLLGFVPVLAYPMQRVLPNFKDKGREGQRKLAFILNLIGYTVAMLWAIFSKVNKQLFLVCITYFITVVLLTICNKALHFRASGHASSFTGPLLLLIYFVSWKAILPCVLFCALVIWSSLALKRHTMQELAGGIIVCAISFALSLLLINIIF